MMIKIAWRNVWRNKTRSLVVAIAIALGLWAGVFASAFYEGMMLQKIDSVIEKELAHFQVHHPKFRDEYLTKYIVPAGQEVVSKLQQDSMVEAVCSRTIATAMMASASHSGGIKAVGIEPADETRVTTLSATLIEGSWFEGTERHPIVISKKTAEKYKIKLKSKIVLTMQDTLGEIVSAAYRVAGIFNSGNGMFDESQVFVKREELQRLVGLEGEVHEIAVRIRDHKRAEEWADRYQHDFPQAEVLPWIDLALGMRYMLEAMDTYAYIVVGIILLALLFSIVNTMLMAVLERVREIGMLMAVGMNRKRVFTMIMLETIFLTMLGGPTGLLIGFSTVYYTGSNGIDMGAMGETYSDMGFQAVVYPALGVDTYVGITIMVVIMALIASIYPARKALKLNPSEAIRKI